MIKKIYKKNFRINKIGFVNGEMLKTHGCNKLLKRNFTNTKFTDIKFGLKKTVLWYLENQSWWKRVLSGEYRLERLGDNI